LAVGLIFGAYAVVMRFVQPDDKVSVEVFAAVLAAYTALLVTLAGYLVREIPKEDSRLKIEAVREKGHLFLIQKNEVLGQDMGAIVYFREGKYERRIGFGRVQTVQMDGKVQLVVEFVDTLEPDLVMRIAENEEAVRSNLIIRAGIIMMSPNGGSGEGPV